MISHHRFPCALLNIVPGAFLLLQSAPPPPSDDAPRCPSPYYSNTRLWHTIPNVGPVLMIFRPPQVIQRRILPAYVLYVPSSVDPMTAPDGSVWLAEGPYWANCVRSGVPNYHLVVPERFEGTVWQALPPPDEPPPGGCGDGEDGDPEEAELRAPSGDTISPPPFLFDCAPGGGGSGGGGGGGGGGGDGGLGGLCDLAGPGTWDVYVDDVYVGTIVCVEQEGPKLTWAACSPPSPTTSGRGQGTCLRTMPGVSRSNPPTYTTPVPSAAAAYPSS